MSILPISNDPDPETVAPDDVVSISRAELEELRRRAGSAPSATDREDSRASGSGPDGATSSEAAARDLRVEALESACRRAVLDRELAMALAGRPLVAGAAAQLVKLWRDDFDVYEEAGTYQVASRDGRTIGAWMADRLGGPEYAHFQLPSSRGGSGSRGLSQSSEGDGVPTAARTLGEAVVMQWRESTSSRPGAPPSPSGWGRRR